MSESPKKQIEKFVLEWWDYPSKKDMDNFIYRRDYIYRAAQLGDALIELQEEGKILYDDKHDRWLWIETSEKMKELIEKGEFIKID